jgi:hypothetical protein
LFCFSHCGKETPADSAAENEEQEQSKSLSSENGDPKAPGGGKGGDEEDREKATEKNKGRCAEATDEEFLM